MLNELLLYFSFIAAGDDSVQNVWDVGPSAKLGYVAQESGVPPYLTVRQALSICAALKLHLPPSGLHDRSLAQFGYADLVLPLTSDVLDRSVASLSGGTLKKLQVVLGMLGRPSLLMMDEPTTGVDPFAADAIMSVLDRSVRESSEQCVVLTTHRVHECIQQNLCNLVCVLVDGQLAYLSDVSTFQSSLCKYFQADVFIAAGHTCEDFTDLLNTSGLEIQRLVRYGGQFMRCSFNKAVISIDQFLRIVQTALQDGVVKRVRLKAMELDEIVSSIIR